jgi:hypothetical protein
MVLEFSTLKTNQVLLDEVTLLVRSIFLSVHCAYSNQGTEKRTKKLFYFSFIKSVEFSETLQSTTFQVTKMVSYKMIDSQVNAL